MKDQLERMRRLAVKRNWLIRESDCRLTDQAVSMQICRKNAKGVPFFCYTMPDGTVYEEVRHSGLFLRLKKRPVDKS